MIVKKIARLYVELSSQNSVSVGFNVNSFDDNYLNSAELYRLYEWLFFLLFCLPGIFHLYFLSFFLSLFGCTGS